MGIRNLPRNIGLFKTRARLLKNPTAGLVNRVLHKNKVNHTIESVVEKTKHLFKR